MAADRVTSCQGQGRNVHAAERPRNVLISIIRLVILKFNVVCVHICEVELHANYV